MTLLRETSGGGSGTVLGCTERTARSVGGAGR